MNLQPNPRIRELCVELKLAHMKDTWYELASDTSLSHEDYLLEILTAEYENRLNNGIARRLKDAKFPYKKYLVDFDKTKYPEEFTPEFEELETLEFIKENENILLIGTPGAGKTHFAIALGIAACMAGESVYFATVSNLMIELKEALSNMQITRFRQKFERYSLVILDELGYVSFDRESADLLFNLISSRNHKGSIIVTTNLTFDLSSFAFGKTAHFVRAGLLSGTLRGRGFPRLHTCRSNRRHCAGWLTNVICSTSPAKMAADSRKQWSG